MKSDWTEIVREKLSESTVTPPDNLWTGISSELDAVIAVPSNHPRARVWRRVAAAACLLAAIACLVQFFIAEFPDSVLDLDNLADKGDNAITSEVKTKDLHDDMAANSNTSTHYAYSKQQSYKHCMADVAVTRNNAVDQSDKISHDKSGIADQPNEPNLTIEKADSVPTTVIAEDMAYTTTTDGHLEQASDYSPVNKDGQKPRDIFSVSLYASNTNLSSHGSGMNGISNGGIVSSDPIFGTMDNIFSGVQNPALMGYELKDVRHSQPIRLGVSVRLPMSSTISIGTGVIYSRLTSTFTWGNMDVASFESKQTLNYIGVPVSIDFNLPSYRSAGFYMTCGAMVEKCIYGETHLQYSPVTERVSEKNLQTSLFLGAGAEIKLNRRFSIYAEPLATFYIDNHSDIKNIYKDRPLNFDLRIGVRYNLK